jgi:hypothetical protein
MSCCEPTHPLNFDQRRKQLAQDSISVRLGILRNALHCLDAHFAYTVLPKFSLRIAFMKQQDQLIYSGRLYLCNGSSKLCEGYGLLPFDGIWC